MSRPDDPIGFFDSGVGGLTILREAIKALPNEEIVYLGDTARLPYGNKSPSTIIRYTLENVSFLMERKIKLLIVACFTASSYALETLEERLSIPVIGVIQSGCDELIRTTQSGRVAVLGTSSTIRSGIIQSLIQTQAPNAAVFPIACPLFVPFIEEGLVDHPALKLIAKHYLDCLKTQEVDAALLACTHYPLIRTAIQEELGPGVKLVESAACCARKAKEWLFAKGLLNPGNGKPKHRFFASDDPEKFRRLTNQFFGAEITEIGVLPVVKNKNL